MVRKFYPLRPIQRWLVDTHFNKANSTMMNIGGLFKLAAAIDMERLAEAINSVIATHDIFSCRFVFHPETSELCQIFHEEIEPVRVEHLSEEEFQTRMKKLREPYYLIYEPLYRIYLIETPKAKYLYLDFYHATMDGVSLAYLLLREFGGAYRGRNKKTPISYADYVEEESKIPPEQLAEGQAYWRKMLSTFDQKKHLLPTKIQGVAAWTQGNFEYRFKDISEEFFRTKHIEENEYFLGASMLTMAKLTGSRESIMSWIHNGRTTMRERRIMGLMLEQYPCAWDFHEDISFDEFISKLYGQIQVGIRYRKSLNVVYNEGLEDDCVSFIFQKGMYGNLMLADTVMEVIYLPPNEISAVENSLDIEVEETESGFYDLFLDYDASRYSEVEMLEFAQTMNEILLIMRDPNKMVSEVLG